MKQYWQQMALKIDALNLRERGMIFTAAALVLVVLMNTLLLDPQFAKQKVLSQQVTLEQAQIFAIQAEMQAKVNVQGSDPDAANKARLQTLNQQFAEVHGAMQNMQKGLVSPDKMAALLEDVLKQNAKLRLVSLKTLPAGNLNDLIAGKPEEKEAAAASVQARDNADNSLVAQSIYKHGVEIVVEGSYLDIMQYLTELEAMRWQLFWGKARLNVGEHPKATLTLNLFTLSLDNKWLNI